MKQLILNIYPFLIACYPVFALRNYNILYVDLASIIRTLLITIILTGLIWILTNWIVFHDWGKSGILTSITIILIFSYGHIHIESEKYFGEQIRHSYLVIILGSLYFIFVWLATRNPSTSKAVSNFLATVAVVLILMTTSQLLYYEYNTYQAAEALLTQNSQSNVLTSGSDDRPDIYLIVLDAHARADVLREKFNYDSSAFIQELTGMGFYIASCSQSNYASTILSLTSLLRMDYIPPAQSKAAKLPPFKETAVLRKLASNEYTVITFENRTSGHFDLQEDIRLSHNQLFFGELNLTGGLNEFEKIMLDTSVAKLLLDTRIIRGFNTDGLTKYEDYEHYQQTQFILSKLPEVPQLRSPKFVLVHILVPHSPFIFTADGNFRYPEDTSKNGYRDNAEFIDRRILAAIHAILDQSAQPPIIILMGDHGPPPGRLATQEDRLTILNAYYVNSETRAKLYDSISPVNSFRLILNEYFGEDYPLLKDISYAAYKLKQLNDARVIENTCTPAAQ
jgi:hypothetical protein